MLWSERKAKDETRKKVLLCLNPYKDNLILNLPGNEILFEQMVTSMANISKNEFVLFERDGSLVPEIRRKLDQLPINYSLQNQDVDIYLQGQLALESPARKFDLIWLDYCGPLTPLRLSIAARLRNLVTDTGTYAFTFMMGREHGGMMDIIDAFGANEAPSGGSNLPVRLPDDMSLPLEMRIKTLLKVMWPTCQKTRISILSYNDTVPMYVVIFQKGRLLDKELVPVKKLSVEWIQL